MPRLTCFWCALFGQVQYVSTSAVVQPYVAEIQYISFVVDPNQSGLTVPLSFRGIPQPIAPAISDVAIQVGATHHLPLAPDTPRRQTDDLQCVSLT